MKYLQLLILAVTAFTLSYYICSLERAITIVHDNAIHCNQNTQTVAELQQTILDLLKQDSYDDDFHNKLMHKGSINTKQTLSMLYRNQLNVVATQRLIIHTQERILSLVLKDKS